LRDYTAAVQMLGDLGVSKVRLLTNNPKKIEALKQAGIEIIERIPIHCGRNPHNEDYLLTKADKLGHMLGARSNEAE
jgi:GTP cyclohydrolase II